ncbi:MAG: RNA polymerase sigma factor [Planctomycetota bacterium]
MSITVDGEALHHLVAEARRGNRPAADQMVREHDSWLRSVIYGVSGRVDLVDDIAQQVWMQVWQRLDTLNDPRRLRPWLCTIARRAAIDAGMAHKRRQSRTGSLEQVPEVDGQRKTQSPARSALGGELHATLMQAVQALPSLYREPFVLRHLEDWSYAEIGEVLELPVETVETRLVRARRMLREMLNGKVET